MDERLEVKIERIGNGFVVYKNINERIEFRGDVDSALELAKQYLNEGR